MTEPGEVNDHAVKSHCRKKPRTDTDEVIVHAVQSHYRKKPRADSYPRRGKNKALPLRCRLRCWVDIIFFY